MPYVGTQLCPLLSCQNPQSESWIYAQPEHQELLQTSTDMGQTGKLPSHIRHGGRQASCRLTVISTSSSHCRSFSERESVTGGSMAT